MKNSQGVVFPNKKLYLKFKKMNDTLKTKKHVSTVLDKECDTVENCVDV